MSESIDRLYLRAALELAHKGMYTTTPNPRVGCLIVKDGQVIGRGWHMIDGEEHAEIAALANCTSSTQGATAYVSLEPCCFSGRTGSCVQALIKSGIKRVVVAQTDPHPEVFGNGIEALREAGVETILIELPEAIALNAGYFQRQVSGRPYVRLKCAISLDGRVAMASGESRWITGEQARADVQYWRARSCAVLTGIGTVLKDDPQLTVRDEEYRREDTIRQPVRVVVDRRLRIPDNARILNKPGRIRVYHSSPRDRIFGKVECVRVSDGDNYLSEVLTDLGDQKMNEILVEAGPRLIASFVQAQLWDELIVYCAPKLMGSSAQPLAALEIETMAEAVTVQKIDVRQFGADTRTIYRRIQKDDKA